MKGLVKYAKGEGNMAVQNVDEPKAGAGQIKVEIKAAGICGSDLHIYHDDIAGIPINPPVVTGHEFSGVVTEVGQGVKEWRVGDRVTSETDVRWVTGITVHLLNILLSQRKGCIVSLTILILLLEL